MVIGDHCTDETEELLKEIKDPRLRFYNLPTRGKRYPETVENHWLAGPVVASNKALELARGKWIARIDDDDIWTPDHLEKLLEFAQEENFEFVSAQNTSLRKGVEEVGYGYRALDPYYTPQAGSAGRQLQPKNRRHRDLALPLLLALF